jgi:hypothetical protein
MLFRTFKVLVLVASVATIGTGNLKADTLESQHWPVLSITQLQALIDTISGETSLDHIRYISQFWRWAPSHGFHEVAEYVVNQAKSYGLTDAHIERFIADGHTPYMGVSFNRPSWDPRGGELWVVAPVKEKITSFDDIPMCIAGYSRNTDVTAELVDVGQGTSAGDYAGKDVKGKIVLGAGAVGSLQRLAVFEHGALGVISAWMPEFQTSRSPMDYPDSVFWGTGVVPISRSGQPSAFGFMISQRQRHQLLNLLKTHKKLMVHATVKADLEEPGYLEAVTATIPGREFPDQELVFVAHLEHPKPAANDNGSGSATFLEIARVLETLIKSGQLAQPKRTIRFLWVQEGRSTRTYVAQHPEVSQRVFAAINMDQVGEDPVKTKGILTLWCAPASRPSFASDVVQDFFEMVRNINNDLGPTVPLHQILAPTGERRPFIAEAQRYRFGSDEETFLYVGVPGLAFVSWPDVYHHAQFDTPDKADATQLKRVAFIGAASAAALTSAGPQDAILIATSSVGRARVRIAEDVKKALHLLDRATAENLDAMRKEARNVVHQAVLREQRNLDSVRLLAGNDQNVLGYLSEQKQALAASESQPLKHVDLYYETRARSLGVKPRLLSLTEAEIRADKKIPSWAPGVRGVDAEALAEILKEPDLGKRLRIVRYTSQPESMLTLVYNVNLSESLNFIDSKRSIKEIRDAVSGEYDPIPVDVVEELMDVMAEAKLVNMQTR